MFSAPYITVLIIYNIYNILINFSSLSHHLYYIRQAPSHFLVAFHIDYELIQLLLSRRQMVRSNNYPPICLYLEICVISLRHIDIIINHMCNSTPSNNDPLQGFSVNKKDAPSRNIASPICLHLKHSSSLLQLFSRLKFLVLHRK